MAKTKKSEVENKKLPAAKKQADGCSLSGIAREWDQVIEVKERLLEGGNPLHPKTPPKQEDNNVCILNKDLLLPVLSRMAVISNRPIPTIDDLRDEFSTLLILSKRSGSDTVGVVEESAQTIKKLIVFVKAKTRRREVSTVTRLYFLTMLKT